MNKIFSILIAIIALAVVAPCHAKEISKQTDLECLAKNIYYEAASEPEEGKVAVGLVTINRSNHAGFPSSICGVVNQRTVYSVSHDVIKVRTVTEGRIFKKTYQVKETITVWSNHAICQFSWRCENARKIRSDDARWNASLEVAQVLLAGGYDEFRYKYRNAMYFHEKHVRPAWAKQKLLVEKIGGHIFYADRNNKRDEYLLTSNRNDV